MDQTYADIEIHIGKREGDRGYPVVLRLDGAPRCDRPGYLDASLLPWIESADPEEDGERLFGQLFAADRLRITWAQLEREAPQRHIRLVIDAEAPELHAVPWEILRDPGGDAPHVLAASVASPFSRFLAVEGPPAEPADSRRIKILAAIANPANLDEYGLQAIDVEQEVTILKEALAGQDTFQLTVLRAPCTPDNLARELQDGYDVLHFIGHGAFADNRAMLFMEGDANRVRLVGDQELAEMIARQLRERPGAENRLRLIFLDSCQTATRSTADAYLGLAPRLVKAGVPAVLATQDAVSVVTAQRFAAAFYRRLVRHGLVDLAANEARAAVLNARLPGAAIPVLFMRLKDGQLLRAALTPQQERAYLDLVQQAFGHWQDLYVRQEADRLQDPIQAAPQRIGRLPHRQLEHVQEQSGMVTRTRLEVGLADWLLDNRRLALLAVPGCGKSTALEEVAWELAQRQLTEPALDLPLPVLVPLGGYAAGEPWLAFVPRALRESLVRSLIRFGDWDQRGLSPVEADLEAGQRVRRILAPFDGQLEQLRQQGRLLLLLDGLNELRGGADGPLREAVQDFVADSVGLGNRVAVACRIADYQGLLAQLPRVELLPFDDERIRQGLAAYLQQDGQVLWDELVKPENARIREMLAIPLYVETLGEPGVLTVDQAGRPRLPANRGIMLARFAQALMERELSMARRSGRPMVPVDLQRQTLAEVAYRMRDELASRGSVAALADIDGFVGTAQADHPGYQPEWILSLAAGAKLVDLSRQEGSFSFWKEPVQEYFAACHLLERFARGEVVPCQERWAVSLGVADIAAGQTRLGEPPRYPQTPGGWEETTILAAGLAPAYAEGGEEKLITADDFVAAVLAVNPALAGRCLHEGGAQVSASVKKQVIDGLAQAMVEPAYSTKVRAPCGVLLGRLGDPRFHGPDRLCLPREPLLGFVEVPAGPFLMGSDTKTVAHWNQQGNTSWFENELGHHLVHENSTSLAARLSEHIGKRPSLTPVDVPYRYWIARYPVTNAQFRCFADNEGYTEHWRSCWSEAGRRWLAGERWSKAMEEYWRQIYNHWRQRGNYFEYKDYRRWFERELWPFLERLRKDQPGERYWAAAEFNAPNQPVVGMTWHEAVAYAAWLDEKLKESPDTPPELRRLLRGGHRLYLPSEAEWEKAARGGLQISGPNGKCVTNPQPGRQWPWGKSWDPSLCNTAEGDDRVGWLNPVGMYPPGTSPYGCTDMVGNIWEWTRSDYRPYPFVVSPADGAEEAEEASLRVVRGGSCSNVSHSARCAVRYWYDPLSVFDNLGVRVVCAPLLF